MEENCRSSTLFWKVCMVSVVRTLDTPGSFIPPPMLRWAENYSWCDVFRFMKQKKLGLHEPAWQHLTSDSAVFPEWQQRSAELCVPFVAAIVMLNPISWQEIIIRGSLTPSWSLIIFHTRGLLEPLTPRGTLQCAKHLSFHRLQGSAAQQRCFTICWFYLIWHMRLFGSAHLDKMIDEIDPLIRCNILTPAESH